MEREKSRIFNIVVALSCMTLFGILSIYSTQDFNWDLRNYHYYGPYALLNNRLFFDYAPAFSNSFFNPVLDLPFYFFHENLTPKAVAFCMGAIQGLNYLLAYLIANAVFSLNDSRLLIKNKWTKRACSLLVAVPAAFGAINVAELGTTFNDNFTSIFVLISLLIIVRTQTSSEERSAKSVLYGMVFAGIALGFASGAKLTTALFAVGSIPAVLALKDGAKERGRFLAVWCVGLFIGAMLSHGYWSFLLWRRFGNPLFPFFNNIFRSPYINKVFHSDFRTIPAGLAKKLFFPFYFVRSNTEATEVPFRDIRFAVVYVMLAAAFIRLALLKIFRGSDDGAAALKTATDRRLTLFFVIFFVSSYILWQEFFASYRYAVPLEIISPIFIVILLSYILKGLSKRYVAVSAVLIFVALLSTVQYPKWGRSWWGDDYFGVTVPNMEYEEGTIIFVASHESVAFTIPYFPPHIRFVNLFNLAEGMLEDQETNQMQVEIHELIAKQTAPMYVILPYFANREWYAEIKDETYKSLNKYGLTMMLNDAKTIIRKGHRGSSPLHLCKVMKLNK